MSKNTNLPILIIAVLLTVVIESFSIYGSSHLFGGAKMGVIVLCSILAVGKMAIAFLLKVKRDKLERYLKIYLVFAILILSLWTSVGIYGFLSDAYSITKRLDDRTQTQIALVKKKKELFTENLEVNKTQLGVVNGSIDKLRQSLSTDNQTQQVVNGKVITNIISTNKSAVQNQLDKANTERDNIQQTISKLQDSVQTLELKILDIESNSDATSELGTLRYMSKITGKDMDTVVNWFMLLIVLICDPLALALFWAYFSINSVKDEKVQTPKPDGTTPTEPAPKKRNVTKKLGRPRKTKKEVAEMIDSVLPTPDPENKKKV
jgi:hypothetical protein